MVLEWPDFTPLATKEAERIKDRVRPSDARTRTRVSGTLSEDIRLTSSICWHRAVNRDVLRVPYSLGWRQDEGGTMTVSEAFVEVVLTVKGTGRLE